jgi:glycosyltransferase involved in cell wall biosynthesis
MNHQIRVLIFVNCYIPGFKGGGPIRSIENLVRCLGDRIDFRVVTADRDYGDPAPYAGMPVHQWVKVGGSLVWYLRPGLRGLVEMLTLLRREDYDVLYLNSSFHRIYTLAPLLFWRLRLIPKASVIIASRGELSRAALHIKKVKKSIFRAFINYSFKLFNGVIWQASTIHEEVEIREFLRDSANVRKVPVLVARDVVDHAPASLRSTRAVKCPGRLDLIFVSRIARKKNLLYALKLLRGLRGEATLRIYGPIQDAQYWEECQNEIASLPGNVKVVYGGVVQHSEVSLLMSGSHVFLFPTFNENFGHVVYEALSQGCIAVISDGTAWRNLVATGAGWDIPLDRPDRFEAALQHCLDMEDATFRAASAKAILAAHAVSNNIEAVRQNFELFNGVQLVARKGREDSAAAVPGL